MRYYEEPPGVKGLPEPAEDEPVFLLRAADPVAPQILRLYSRAMMDHEVPTVEGWQNRRGYATPREDRAVALNEHAAAMEEWRREHAADLG